MKKVSIIIFIVVFVHSHAQSQEQNQDSVLTELNWHSGLSLNPQLLLIGAFDIGLYSSIEYRPFSNSFSTMAGVEVRNRWFQIKRSSISLNNQSLKSIYSLHAITYAGAGFMLPTKKSETNSIYLTVTPYLFKFKERVETPFINNTVSNSSINVNFGLTWTNNKVTKKGRRINIQFYLPIFGSHFLDELRTMSLRVGISI